VRRDAIDAVPNWDVLIGECHENLEYPVYDFGVHFMTFSRSVLAGAYAFLHFNSGG
jgi:hypothetical protein